MPIDSTLQLSAVVRDHDGNVIANPTIAWLVFDTTVARVDGQGLLSGRVLGLTSLVVASGPAYLKTSVTTVTPISSIEIGFRGGCSLAPQGAAYCWGSSVGTPLLVPGGKQFRQVGFGDMEGCGLDIGGAASCWFLDSGGTPGSTTPLTTPVTVGGPAFASLTIGYVYKCGLTGAGAAYCWEAAYDADGNDSIFTTPAAIGGLTFAALSSNYHVCGITTGGPVECWGFNYYGELGNHANDGSCSKACSAVPVPADTTLPTLAIIAAGGYHTCAATAAGVTYCWGDNSSGQLGDTLIGSGCQFRSRNYATDSLYPCSEKAIPVRTALRFTALAAGDAHTCGLTSAGTVYCWGDNSVGEFGDGTTTSSAVPVPAAGGKHFRSLTADYATTCGLGADGVAYCWGYDWFNVLADGPSRGGYRISPNRVLYQP